MCECGSPEEWDGSWGPQSGSHKDAVEGAGSA
jgi:hypothetical protein